MSSTSTTGTSSEARVFVIQGEQQGEALRIPADAATLAGFRRWATTDSFPERGEISFIDGEVILDMSPENLDLHNFLKGEISSVLRSFVRESELGRFFFDRCLLTNEHAQLSTEPDAMFLSYDSHQAGRARYVESRSTQGSYVEVIGSPDWVLEIVSPSSGKKDKELLRRAYHRAGVNEYWIADALGADVKLLILVRAEDEFVECRPDGEWWYSSTFGCAFQIARKKARDGLWDYALNVRP
jgi:Uma2 family endonuclease